MSIRGDLDDRSNLADEDVRLLRHASKRILFLEHCLKEVLYRCPGGLRHSIEGCAGMDSGSAAELTKEFPGLVIECSFGVMRGGEFVRERIVPELRCSGCSWEGAIADLAEGPGDEEPPECPSCGLPFEGLEVER